MLSSVNNIALLKRKHRPRHRAMRDITNEQRSPPSMRKQYLSHQESHPLSTHMDNRIPKDAHGNVLPPETIPGAPLSASFEEPCLFDSDDEVPADVQSFHNQQFDVLNIPLRKQQHAPFQASRLVPLIFDDFSTPHGLQPFRPSNPRSTMYLEGI